MQEIDRALASNLGLQKRMQAEVARTVGMQCNTSTDEKNPEGAHTREFFGQLDHVLDRLRSLRNHLEADAYRLTGASPEDAAEAKGLTSTNPSAVDTMYQFVHELNGEVNRLWDAAEAIRRF